MTVEELKEKFVTKGITLGSVESFTGGSFASLVTSVSGASKMFKGAFVTYATEEKHRLLNIDLETINKYGVVSQEVAYKMAWHGKCLLNVDVCVSFTGNAGPTAMEGKPVGEVYIGIAAKDFCQVHAFNLDGDRKTIQNKAINIALELIEKNLCNF